jgi:hypothetical protein
MAEILQWAAITILALFVIGCVNFIAWLLAARKRALSIMEDLAEEDHAYIDQHVKWMRYTER